MAKVLSLLLRSSLLCVALLLTLSVSAKGGDDEIVKCGMPLPAFNVSIEGGESISNLSMLGRPAVIVLFNTACHDCQRELPLVQQLYTEYKGKVGFVCIARKDSAEAVRRFWDTHGLTLPVSPQTDKTVYCLFARRTIPRIYVADSDGVVRAVYVEKVSKRKLRKMLDSLLW